MPRKFVEGQKAWNRASRTCRLDTILGTATTCRGGGGGGWDGSAQDGTPESRAGMLKASAWLRRSLPPLPNAPWELLLSLTLCYGPFSRVGTLRYFMKGYIPQLEKRMKTFWLSKRSLETGACCF